MTGTTHQMIALLAAGWILTINPISPGPVVATLALITVMIGALTPDLDQPAANLWRRMLAGRAIGNIFQIFSGGHRHLTHSLFGIILIGLVSRWAALNIINPVYQAPAQIIWIAFMIGYISHPIADTLTDRGVPWLWPLHLHIKIPPGPEELRVTTDSFVERLLVRGGLIVSAALLVFRHWSIFLNLFRLS